MGFGHRIRHSLRKAAHVAVKPISKGAGTSIVHGVEKYGKAVGGAYTIAAGGIVGAGVVAHNKKTFGGGAATVAQKAIPIEEAGIGAGLGMIGAGALSGKVNAAINQTAIGDSFTEPGGNFPDAPHVPDVPQFDQGASTGAPVSAAGIGDTGTLVIVAIAIVALLALKG